MEFIIGGYFNNPNLIIDSSIEHFESKFSRQFYFEGINKNNFFMGIVKDKKNQSSNTIITENQIFRSTYSTEILKLKEF